MNGHARSNASGPIIGIVLIFGLGYAVLRCHIAGPVPWKDFLFLVLNKGIALSAFILLTCSFSLGSLSKLGFKVPEGWLNARKAMDMTGFLLLLVHALMSFLRFTPAVYGELFGPDGTLTLRAGLSILGAILAFVMLWAYNLSFQTSLREDRTYIRFITARKFMLFALLLGASHLFFMGYNSWLAPSDWPWGLPPVGLVAFVVFTVEFIANLLGREPGGVDP